MEKKITEELKQVSVVVPLSLQANDGCYLPRHIDIQLSEQDATTLRSIRLALTKTHATVPYGKAGGDKHIDNSNDVIRWLLHCIRLLQD